MLAVWIVAGIVGYFIVGICSVSLVCWIDKRFNGVQWNEHDDTTNGIIVLFWPVVAPIGLICVCFDAFGSPLTVIGSIVRRIVG